MTPVIEGLNKREIERANAYRQMMEMWAWKDFQAFLDEERNSALESAIVLNDISQIQVQRGKVQSLDAIKGQLSYILEGTR